MSIKEDKWIRKMALAHGMIEPFADGQVNLNPETGEKLISYGLSSYGYDLRLSREFKVFTNVYNSLVDPKRFTEDTFISITDDVCIIPPNSFALAHSVEYFRIPRNV
ncbi:putative deoxycytidine triphosphate deaminase, partial [Chlamydia psittaci 08DC60]